MTKTSAPQGFAWIKHGLVAASLAACALGGAAWAQPAVAEPSIQQVYEAARSGKLDQAQVMMQQVLVAHPNSAKAHFVQAELSAAQGHVERARQELATAERLSPGLQGVKPDAVAALRTRLAGEPSSASSTNHVQAVPQRPSATPAAPQAASSSSGFSMTWAIPLFGLAALAWWLLRRRAAASGVAQPLDHGAAGLSSTAFGRTPQASPYAQAHGMGNPAPTPYPASNPGLGSRIAGGLATGAAIGAGMMAAQAIGRAWSDHHDGTSPDGGSGHGSTGNWQPPAGAPDLGGDNFGVADAAGWDDVGGSFADNGSTSGDWDG